MNPVEGRALAGNLQNAAGRLLRNYTQDVEVRGLSAEPVGAD